MTNWNSSSISFNVQCVHFRSFKGILLWRPVSIASLWEDNLSCEITFLYLGVSSMSRYVDLSIVVLICLYRRMDVHVFRPVCQCVIYISRNRCLSNGISMVSFTDSGKHQTSLKQLVCNMSFLSRPVCMPYIRGYRVILTH